MNTRNTFLITCILGGIAFLVGAFLYPQMGERMATHWGISGAADGFGSRFEGLFLLPLIAFGASVLMLAIPYIDPLKSNIEKFRSEYNLFVVFMAGFFYYLYALTILYNFGMRFSMTTLLMPALTLLMLFSGRLLKKTHRNYFIGIRTPWTLANDTVWDKTHQFGGTAFQVVGLITLIGVFFPEQSFMFLMIPLMIAVVSMLIYSFVAFKQLESKTGK
jgi:uncharacterized membrane protein